MPKAQNGSERIKKSVQISKINKHIEINASKKDLQNLINKLIEDEKYRQDFEKDPVPSLNAIGIQIDTDTVNKIRISNISDILPQQKKGVPAVVVIAAVIILAFPSPAH